MKNPNNLQRVGISMVVLLVLQYLLGMAASLFVEFPESGDEAQFWHFAWAQPVVAAHIILGTLLVIGAVVLIILSLRYNDKGWKAASFFGLLGIVIAGFGGSSFISSQQEAYSMTMAVSFIVALLAYGYGLYSFNKISKQ